MFRALPFITALIATIEAQQVCTSQAETHPALEWQKCAEGGSCSSVKGSVVVDANWRWAHDSNSKNCYTGNEWDKSICTDGKTCAEKCCVDGADYSGTYGVTTSGSELNINFVTQGPYSKNVGSRLYLLESEDKYQMFTLLGNEFTFDVDVSKLGCGLNGALYFVSMDQDGGMSKAAGNKGGAKYGLGYCDAQCPRDIKWINGAANSEDWVPSESDPNSGVGKTGSCCAEMDIWEANSVSTAYTPHACDDNAQHTCTGDDCGGTYSDTRYAGSCDPDGCDFNPYRQGDKTFYGPDSSFKVDTSKTVTVVTQFVEEGGQLSEIKRFYVQNDKVIANSESTIAGATGNSITESFCKAQKEVFGDRDVWTEKGGMAQMSDAVSKPMVLVMSLWDDHYANMLWLDSTYPVDSSATGKDRGTCSTDTGKPSSVESDAPSSKVVFSNIKFGPVGSTFKNTGNETETEPPASTETPKTPETQPQTSAAVSEAPEPTSAGGASGPKTTDVQPEAPQGTGETKPVSSEVKPEEPAATSKAPETPEQPEQPEQPETSPDVPVPESKSDSPAATGTGTAPASTPTKKCGSKSSTKALIRQYERCGGTGHTGGTKCKEGLTCTKMNEYYSQCI